MNIRLPDSIATFFQVSNDRGTPLPRHCLAEGALVHDEGQVYQGYDAIQAWLLETQRKYAYRVEPLAVAQDGAAVSVQAKLVGNFPGSPVQLTYSFVLLNNKISSLEIQ
ncbi:MAG: nuclear transport factor 2 family protein [Burkholderiaceae bacterium]|nr:nuclear transport factor 2 family protein [Burkholderiaceae bacterium]